MAIVHILMPMNTKAKNWMDTHIKSSIMPFGNGRVILSSEVKYLDVILAAMEKAGFKRGTKKDVGKKNANVDYIVNIFD